ncbi:Mss4-like protein [Mycena amicta]|nr:Mss4-like protein [Mycena amicta]
MYSAGWRRLAFSSTFCKRASPANTLYSRFCSTTTGASQRGNVILNGKPLFVLHHSGDSQAASRRGIHLSSLPSPPMASDAPELVQYKGNCHCGGFIFTFKTPEIKEANTCDCSICSKNGYLWVPLTEDRFEVVKGDEDTSLTTYEFGKKAIAHKFCHVCGTSVMARTKDPNVAKTVSVLVNIRTVQRGINFDALRPGKVFKGSALGKAYKLPEHVPPAIDPVPPGLRVYHGNCHCGAVAFSLLSEEKITRVTECNCSICWRDGALWTYPDRSALNFRGLSDSLREYGFASKAVTHGFCKVCGVSMYEHFIGDGTIAPNVRTMGEDVDLSTVRVGRVNGKYLPTSYVPPV